MPLPDREQSPQKAIFSNVGLAAGWLAIVVLTAKMLAVARFDPVVALGIAHSVGPANALYGVLVQSGPGLIWIATVFVWFLAGRESQSNFARWGYVSAGAFTALCSFTPPPSYASVRSTIPYYVGLAIVGAGAYLAGSSRQSWATGVVIAVVVGATLSFLVTDQMWLPSEALLDRSVNVAGRQVAAPDLVGYVVDEGKAGQLLVLDERTRTLLWVAPPGRRVFCRLTNRPDVSPLLTAGVTLVRQFSSPLPSWSNPDPLQNPQPATPVCRTLIGP